MTDHLAQMVLRSQADVRRLIGLGRGALRAADMATAAALVAIAARVGHVAHAGIFASSELDELLRGLASRPASAAAKRSGKIERVLHVLTYALPVGGDTRFVYRWIRRDTARQHSVAVGRHTNKPAPEELARAATDSGGMFRWLAARWTNPLAQAAELRALFHQVDAVFLHLRPDDIAPLIAAASCDEPRVTIVNHSDHTFWLGGSIVDAVAHLRRQSDQFLLSRRGLRPRHQLILPIPLQPTHRASNPADAKRSLGLSEDTVVLLTVASPYKYDPIDTVSLLDLVLPVLRRHANTRLIAIGPADQAQWQTARIATNNQVLPLGTRWDTAQYYAAADIYLDSFPFSSITSLLEAGSQRAALLAYCPDEERDCLLGAGAPGLDASLLRCHDANSYRETLERLITEPQFRTASGSQAEQMIRHEHYGSAWESRLASLYAALQSCDCAPPSAAIPEFRTGPLDRAVAALQDRLNIGLSPVIDAYLSALPYPRRATVLLKLLAQGFDASLSLTLPPCIESRYHGQLAGMGNVLRRLARLAPHP